jgi:hypothetical protein
MHATPNVDTCCRWFCKDGVEVPEARFLDIILYSREQLLKEYAAMPSAKGDGAALPDAPWGIISIKAQDEDHETPMQVGAGSALVAEALGNAPSQELTGHACMHAAHHHHAQQPGGGRGRQRRAAG